MKRSGFKRGKPWPDRHEIARKARVPKPLVPKALGKRLAPKAEAPWRSAEHKRRVVLCGCLVPRHSKAPTECWGPVDPHHVTKWRKGWGQPPDWTLVPLCRKHHDESQGKDAAFEERHGINFARWISRFSAVGANEIAKLEAAP